MKRERFESLLRCAAGTFADGRTVYTQWYDQHCANFEERQVIFAVIGKAALSAIRNRGVKALADAAGVELED